VYKRQPLYQGLNLAQINKKEQERLLKLEHELLIQMGTYIKQYPKLKEDYQRLLSISGVGKKTAISLLTLYTYKQRHFSYF